MYATVWIDMREACCFLSFCSLLFFFGLFLGYKGKMVLFQDTLVTNPTISLVRKSEILA